MKPPTRRIVCATDFSANARGAADVAAAIARRLRAKLVLVHVTDESHVHIEGTKEFSLFISRVEKRLWKEALRLRFGGANVEQVLLHGASAGAAIVKFLKRDPPAFAVTSSVSKTAFDRWTIGSVSERISQRSPVPTLVVRAPERLVGWARQSQPLNVLVAADFPIRSAAPLSWVRGLRKIGACTVTVARINPALVQLATDARADLIVIGTHQWRGLKRLIHPSTSRSVLRHAPMSVACVPVARAVARNAQSVLLARSAQT